MSRSNLRHMHAYVWRNWPNLISACPPIPLYIHLYDIWPRWTNTMDAGAIIGIIAGCIAVILIIIFLAGMSARNTEEVGFREREVSSAEVIITNWRNSIEQVDWKPDTMWPLYLRRRIHRYHRLRIRLHWWAHTSRNRWDINLQRWRRLRDTEQSASLSSIVEHGGKSLTK